MRKPGKHLSDSQITLSHSYEDFADFFESAPVSLQWIGPDGTILRANRAQLELLGFSCADYIGRSLEEFHVDRAEYEELWRRLLARQELRDYEARLWCKDGSVKHILLDANGKWEEGELTLVRCFARDISDQKRAEETLRFLSEGDAGYICVALWDGRDVELEWASEGFTRVTGYTVEEFNARLAALALHPDDMGTALQDVQRLLNGETVRNEVRIARKDGEMRWLRYLAQPSLRSGDLRFLRVYGAAQDITERKEGGERVYEAERRFRQMAGSIQEVFWLSDLWRTQIFYCSPAYEQIWGRTCESFYEDPLSLFESVVPEDRERFAAALERQARGEAVEVEYRILRPDDSVRWIRDRSFPVREPSGEVSRVAGVADDITERKRAEQTNRFLADASAALAELSDYCGTLLRLAELAVPAFADWCTVDMQAPDGSLRRLAVTHVDPIKARLLEELFRSFPPQPSDLSGVMKVLRTGEPEWVPEIPKGFLSEFAPNDEHRRILVELGFKSYLCVPLRARSGPIGVLTFVTANSGRRYDAADLRAAQDLANRVVIAIENANLLAELQESDRRKDEFLAVLAHELRNPLAPIRNGVHLLRSAAPAAPGLQRTAEMIERQVQQMVRLVDDLLDVSRITRGKIVLRKERIELGAVVRSAVEGSRPLIEKAGHELALSLPSEPVFLDADPTRLAQVVANLLNNAANYTPPGGRIWLSAERESQPDGPRAVIRVRDTGMGIPAEMLPRIFEMFTQGDPSLERSHGGLGIGLTLSQRLVELHGGTIQAHSDGAGRGSEFVVRLPILTSPPLANASGQDAPAAPTKGPLTVLVADDNRDAAETLEDLLRLWGHEVHVANDGEEAVTAATRYQPNIVLMDIGMPKLNGYDAARRIRKELDSGIVLVAVTGWGQDEDRRRSREAGFDHHLTKPIDLDNLRRLLTEVS